MNWMRFRPIYFLISGAAVTISLYAVLTWGFKPSIDFTGGSLVEYKFEQSVNKPEVELNIRQKTGYRPQEVVSSGDDVLFFKFGSEFEQKDANQLKDHLSETTGGKVETVRFETVGPALSSEILQKTYVAVFIAIVGILFWIAWQFRSLQFGLSAILAMLHDTLIVAGVFSLLGFLRGVEVDVLFVTALLTTLSFSVHDTIVVYDRIRETKKGFSDTPLVSLANKAVTETMVRSVNNSLTIIFMLVALFLMGGETIKWFVFALFVGAIAGTYSSPFVAVPLLVTWEQIKNRMKGARK